MSSPTPKPKGVNMRDLKKRMGQDHESSKEKIKHIRFPLPDLTGPEGNAFALLKKSEQLMKDEGIQDFLFSEFQSEAMSGGTYEHVLVTIRKWFTITVPTVTYAPLEDDDPLPLPNSRRTEVVEAEQP